MGVPQFNTDSMFFTGFRQELSFPYYGEEKSAPFLIPNELVIVVYVCAVAWTVSFLTALGTRGSSKLRVGLQSFATLTIGTSILLCITGGSWQTSSELETAFNMEEYIHGKVPVHPTVHMNIGLNSANMTIHIREIGSEKQIASFNHDIHWWRVTEAEEDYQKALAMGYPTPILSMAEYLSVDEGGLRYMRAFRSSGFVVYILMWTSFSFWVVANILANMDVYRASIVFLLSGLGQVVAVIVYASLQPANFKIPLHNGQSLTLSFGWNFWLTMVVGILTVLLSGTITLFSYYMPEEVNKVFNNTEEIHVPFDDAIIHELEEKPAPRVVKMFHSIKRRSQALSVKKGRVSKPAKEATISEEDAIEEPNPEVRIERQIMAQSLESIDDEADRARLRRLNNSIYVEAESEDEGSVDTDEGTIDRRKKESSEDVRIEIPEDEEKRVSVVLPAVTIGPEDQDSGAEVIEMEPIAQKTEERGEEKPAE